MKEDKNLSSGPRNFIKKATLATSGIGLSSLNMQANVSVGQPSPKVNPTEWRNKQTGMAYRQLGRTGLMVSEMVIGGAGLNPDNYKFMANAVEKGVNYIDTAWRYGNHKSELGVAKLLQMVGREKLYVATKLSPYLPKIDQIFQDIFKGLPSNKQNELVKKAEELVEQRMVRRPGYYYRYFDQQDNEFTKGYLNHILKMEYGGLSKNKKQIKKEMHKALTESLTRLETNHVDVLLCPHGARLPEELDDEAIFEVFQEAKQQGKVRFSGVSVHTDVPNVLNKAVQTGNYDMAMVAYNIINQASMDMAVLNAAQHGMGIIAMKAARVVNPGVSKKTVPQWRIDKLNTAIPGNTKVPLKAYLWVLQNPNVSAVISDLRSEEMINENLQLVGKKVDLVSL
jgi:predicted aldo/keto reductase-like oxidoreductase